MVGVYRTTARNLVVCVVVGLLALLGASDPAGGIAGASWSWRLGAVVVVGSLLGARAWRRGVVVHRSRLVIRKLWVSWSVGWPAVEACGVGDPLVTPTTERGVVVVTLLDGSTRRGRVGRGRRRDPGFAQAVADVRGHARGRPAQPVGPNKPLVAFLLAGVGCIAALAIAETGRMNQRLHRLEQVSYSPAELRQLRIETAVATGVAPALAVAMAVTGMWAVLWTMRPRELAALNRWPATLAFPETTGSADSNEALLNDLPKLVVGSHGVHRADGTLVAAISQRQVPWTPIVVHTFWSAPGVADFSVHVHSGGASDRPRTTTHLASSRLHITSWHSPFEVELEEAQENQLILRSHDDVTGRIVEAPESVPGCSYLMIDVSGRTLATLKLRRSSWECTIVADLCPMTRRILVAAAVWAGMRLARIEEAERANNSE